MERAVTRPLLMGTLIMNPYRALLIPSICLPIAVVLTACGPAPDSTPDATTAADTEPGATDGESTSTTTGGATVSTSATVTTASTSTTSDASTSTTTAIDTDTDTDTSETDTSMECSLGSCSSLVDCCEGYECVDQPDETWICQKIPEPPRECLGFKEKCHGDSWCCEGLVCENWGDIDVCQCPRWGSETDGDCLGGSSSSSG